LKQEKYEGVVFKPSAISVGPSSGTAEDKVDAIALSLRPDRALIANSTRTLKRWRRKIYGLRSFVPVLRRRHQLEAMVGPLGFWNQLQDYQLRVVRELGLRPEDSLLDIGCGPLQGGIAFIRYLNYGCYVGVDHNRAAIDIGRQEISRLRLGEKKPRLIVSHVFGDEQLGSAEFKFIWLSQIFYYFDEPTVLGLFEMAARRLHPDGVMAADIFGPSSDRSFLRDPQPPAHTANSLDLLARKCGLRVVELGPLSQFGYPKRLGLRHNVLLRITKNGEASFAARPGTTELISAPCAD
jgi:SAM-dependent methyltransferase